MADFDDLLGGLAVGKRLYDASKSGGSLLNEVIKQGLLTARAATLDKQTKQFTQSLASSSESRNAVVTANVDWRARLRPKNGGKDIFWKGMGGSNPGPTGDYLMRPLYESNGLIWQYTPNMLVNGRATYNLSEFYGQNYPTVTYKNSAPPTLIVASDFTANTIDEARYMLGVLHFLRVATKSYFGDTAVENGMYGTPPPVMLFEYLGDHGFNKVPVVVTDYTYNFPDNVDYVPVQTTIGSKEVTYVPVQTNIAVTLQPTYTPHKLRKQFDLNAFATGQQYKDGFI